MLLCFLSLTSCASTHEVTGTGDDYDPLESYNRTMSSFNELVDDAVLKPVAKGYRFATPEFFRKGVRNVLDNIRQPIYFANNLLQGDLRGAGYNLQRFTVNTLAGVVGVFDVATHEDLPDDKEDFGQTLGAWGVGAGPYFVLPILGPSNFRDTVGLGVDWYVDPLNRYSDNVDKKGIALTRAAVGGISLREENIETIDSLKETSIDFYATMRSIYRQRRAEVISDGDYEPYFPDDFED
jgi:phospholipid-binding lipoprotein MlaA